MHEHMKINHTSKCLAGSNTSKRNITAPHMKNTFTQICSAAKAHEERVLAQKERMTHLPRTLARSAAVRYRSRIMRAGVPAHSLSISPADASSNASDMRMWLHHAIMTCRDVTDMMLPDTARGADLSSQDTTQMFQDVASTAWS